jgi:hypothetical protein
MLSAERLMVELSSTTSMRKGEAPAVPLTFPDECSSAMTPSLVIAALSPPY